MADTKDLGESLLKAFLGEFETFIGDMLKHALKAAEDEDEKAVISAFHPTLVSQVKELNAYALSSEKRASKQQKAEVAQLMKISSGVSLAKNGNGLLGSIGSAIGKLGISRIVKEIKKIIREIFKLLGIKFPRWLDGIFLLIDEIVDAILGAGSAKIASVLSRQEQNYLAELAQLEKLQQASSFRWDSDDDEDF